MAGKEQYSVANVIKALRKSKGMKGPAAKMLGCSWNAVDGYEKRHATVRAVIAEERETMTDVAEQSLARAIERGEAWAVCFYLKTQGKRRGYVERHQVSQDITVTKRNDVPTTADEIREVERHIRELERDISGDPRG